MDAPDRNDRRLFVLDTNVLMHDPSALFRFHEHDLYIPMVVLEELDAGKKGTSETARNARQATRYLAHMLQLSMHSEHKDLSRGIPITHPDMKEKKQNDVSGHLFFQTEALDKGMNSPFNHNTADNTLLRSVLQLSHEAPHRRITIVSKDINLRIKACLLQLHAEDYHNDQVLDDLALMHSGMVALSDQQWNDFRLEQSWQEEGKTYYTLSGSGMETWHVNEGVFVEDGPSHETFEALVRTRENDTVKLEFATDYRKGKNELFSIRAKNKEQNFALNLLMDPNIDIVTLLGPAGTGKTLLTLAAALSQTLHSKRYREIIVTRATIPLGESIGFLPGTESEKMTPWMGAILDNMEVLFPDRPASTAEESIAFLNRNRITIRSMNFMRGRTFLNKFLILDEAQNLTSKQMRALITRAGPGTKIVCLGNVGQIDTPYLSETTCGLTYVVQQFQNWPHAGHIILTRGERSRLADHASDIL